MEKNKVRKLKPSDVGSFGGNWMYQYDGKHIEIGDNSYDFEYDIVQ